MAQFQPGKVIKTTVGTPLTIVKYLASGGQGDVYVVDYNGEKKALKWYTTSAFGNPDAFYDNLQKNVAKRSPDAAFLWPIAVTEKTEGSFGYVMDLRPEGYYEFSRFLSSPNYNFASFRAATEACIQIVSAFRILHNNGYSYQDINDGNFFIDPTNGNVLICDNDNVAPNGTNMGVLGKPRYMAPEIVVGKGKVLPNTQSDRYSLAAILFMLLCSNHPLEGERWVKPPCMTDEYAYKLYGTEPLFLYDPNNKANGPVRGIHKNVMKSWSYMPAYLKDAFLKAFSQEALHDPNRRLRELDWLKVLVRFRSDIVRCGCGNEVFIQNAATTQCESCGKPIVVDHTIRLPEYAITAAKGSRVYRCQLGTCNADEALDPVLLVVAKPDGAIGVKNMTRQILGAQTPSGKAKQVQPQEIVPFKSGIKLDVFDKTIELM